MTFEELQKANRKLEWQANMCYARQARNREEYKRQNAPLHIRKYQRITLRLRVTEETRKHLTDKERAKRKWQLGYEYTVTGCFDGWYIHEEGKGELKPCFFRGPSYSRFDDVLEIWIADRQNEGSCKECRRYRDGLCYKAGGMDISRKCATSKVGDDDFPCPMYEEKMELWNKYDGSHFPNVVYLRNADKPVYRIFSLNWVSYVEYSPEDLRRMFSFEPIQK